MSPTQRSLAKMRAEGYFCAVTEHWNQYAKIRQDLFGFIDVLCIRGNETVAVQCTTASHVSERVSKIMALLSAAFWNAGHDRSIVVHGWAKTGPRGKRKTWTCREVWVSKI